MVNGRVVKNEFPDWHEVLNMSRLDMFKRKERADADIDSHLYSVATEIDQGQRSPTVLRKGMSTR